MHWQADSLSLPLPGKLSTMGQVFSKYFAHVSSSNHYYSIISWGWNIIIYILQMSKLRYRKVRLLPKVTNLLGGRTRVQRNSGFKHGSPHHRCPGFCAWVHLCACVHCVCVHACVPCTSVSVCTYLHQAPMCVPVCTWAWVYMCAGAPTHVFFRFRMTILNVHPALCFDDSVLSWRLLSQYRGFSPILSNCWNSHRKASSPSCTDRH